MARLSLDTNVLIYAVDLANSEKHKRAKGLIGRAATADLVLTQQVLGEYLNVVLKRMPEQHVALRQTGETFSRVFPVVATLPALLFAAYDRAVRYKLQFWDAVIITVCLANGVSHLLSEDLQDGQTVDGLTIVNPFNQANHATLEMLLTEAA